MRLLSFLTFLGLWVSAFAEPAVTSSTAYEASHVIKTTPAYLVSVYVYNSKASTLFIQVFNATSLPAESSVPVLFFTVAATSDRTFTFPTNWKLSTGIVVVASTTGPTKTIDTSNDTWFDVWTDSR